MPLWSLPAIRMSWYFLLELQLYFITAEYLRIISWTRHWFKTSVKDIRFCSANCLTKSDFPLHQLDLTDEFAQNGHVWLHPKLSCDEHHRTQQTKSLKTVPWGYKHLFQLLLVLCATSTLHSHFFDHFCWNSYNTWWRLYFWPYGESWIPALAGIVESNNMLPLLQCKISLFHT